MERLRRDYPQYKIVLTFFSPSGYEMRKDYPLASHVFYMPLDSYNNARLFIKLLNPALVIFVKYEFWYYYLTRLKQNNIPAILVAAAFRANQPFFKWYGGLFRKVLASFRHIFVQDIASKELLSGIGFSNNVEIGGDTRYDRVVEIADNAKAFPLIEQFKVNNHLLIAGSTWGKDEILLKEWLSAMPANWKLVIAPHEIGAAHLAQLKDDFKGNHILYSQLGEDIGNDAKKTLIIDNIGMLSGLFRYGSIAFIGGGFQKGGIHNTLEPAVFGLPVIFGDNYEKFVEAVALVKHGFGFPVDSIETFTAITEQLITRTEAGDGLRNQISSYIRGCTGATEKLMRLLANEYLKAY